MKEGTKVRIDLTQLFEIEKQIIEGGNQDVGFTMLNIELDKYVKANNITELTGTIKEEAFSEDFCTCDTCKKLREKYGTQTLIQIDIDSDTIKFECYETDKAKAKTMVDEALKSTDPVELMKLYTTPPPRIKHEQCQFIPEKAFVVLGEV